MDRFQLRRDTAARWAEVNPILLEGEVGFETDTKRRKIGDGVHRWNVLEYLAAENIVQETGDSDKVVMSQKAVTEKLSELGSEVGNAKRNVVFLCDWVTDIKWVVNVSKTGDIFYNSRYKKIYVCTNYKESPQSSLYTEYSLEKGSVYIYDNNVYLFNGDVLLLDMSPIFILNGIAANQSSFQVGDVFYNTTAKEVRKKTADYDYVTLNTKSGDLAIFGTELYVFVGNEIINIGGKIENRLDCPDEKSILSAAMGARLNKEKVGKKTINLFDKNNLIQGAYVGSDFKLSYADNCIASSMIPIKPNTLYSWNADGSNMNIARFVAEDGVTGMPLLNESGETLSYSENNYGVILSPNNAAYFQFTVDFLGRKNIAESACLIESNTKVESYQPYGLYLDIDELPSNYRNLPEKVAALESAGGENFLRNKKIHLCGDSIMNGALFPLDKRIYGILSDKYGASCKNVSLDGSVFFYPMSNDKESIYWQVTQCAKDADYILIQGGVNGMNMTNPDSTPYYPMGEITDSYSGDFDLNTQIGCLEAIFKYIYSNLPYVKVGFIMTYQVGQGYSGYKSYWEKKAVKFKEVVDKWGVPFLDWRNSGVNLSANAENYGVDGWALYPIFDENTDYVTDDKVVYDNKLYKANRDLQKGVFNSADWTLVSTSRYDTWHCNDKGYAILADMTADWLKSF